MISISSVVFALALSSIRAFAAPSLSLSLSAPSSVDGVENFKVQTTVTNTGDEAITLLKDPNTILTGHNTEAFSISHANGNGSPQFTGMRVKYSPNAILEHNVKEGILTLEPGKSYTVEHPFAGTYDFTKTGEGDYDLAVNNVFTTVTGSNKLSTIQAEAGQPTKVSLSGTLASNKPEENSSQTLNTRAVTYSRDFFKRAITFVGCTAAQQPSITQAANDATTLVTQSATYLQGITAATPRWMTWFGTYSDANRREILAYFTRISAANAPLNTQYNCNCNDPTLFASINPLTPGFVNICPLFFAAPALGTDSKAGTIVHENTHFIRYGGSIDVANTQTQATCMALATNNVPAALLNANNIEYFAENTPALA